jgi:hypothetical protein
VSIQKKHLTEQIRARAILIEHEANKLKEVAENNLVNEPERVTEYYLKSLEDDLYKAYEMIRTITMEIQRLGGSE